MRRSLASSILLGSCLAIAATACSPSVPNTGATDIASIAITGSVTLSATGQTSQLTAVATLTNGGTQVITGQATWQTTNASIATVSPAGVLTSVGFGLATVTATYQGITGLADVTVALDMSGAWKGSATDSISNSQFSVAISQNGTTITGALTGTTTNSLGTNIPISASFSGSVTSGGTAVSYSIVGNAMATGGAPCAINLSGTGQVTNLTFTSPYTGSYACLGSLSNGLITMTKQ